MLSTKNRSNIPFSYHKRLEASVWLPVSLSLGCIDRDPVLRDRDIFHAFQVDLRLSSIFCLILTNSSNGVFASAGSGYACLTDNIGISSFLELSIQLPLLPRKGVDLYLKELLAICELSYTSSYGNGTFLFRYSLSCRKSILYLIMSI